MYISPNQFYVIIIIYYHFYIIIPQIPTNNHLLRLLGVVSELTYRIDDQSVNNGISSQSTMAFQVGQ